ncbi:hypothetical protein KJ359_003321 [Pestalotiopsis sp. 9143b]|nr:hypothetical protein KJ359_003321 [Pestalotiopsis sp. 9143b]
MAAGSTASPVAGPFAFTKFKLLLIVSLAITWYIAGLFPHYRPQIQESFKNKLDEAKNKLDEAKGKIPSVKVDWHPSLIPDYELNPHLRYNTSKVALLIEPRPLPHLVPQLLHMITVVPPDWRFVFIGSKKSIISVGRSYATKHQQAIGKLDLVMLPEPWDIRSKEGVYRTLTDARFYNEFLPGAEWLLKFESDSILCANSESSLNDWLHWDWAGAPRTADDRFSGNGGLSLRRVSAIQRVLKFQERTNDTGPEDEWFGTRLWVLPGAKVASGTDGQLAVEDTYIPNPMGYHVRDGGNNLHDAVWQDPTQRKAIFEYCPELSLIMNMKLEVERCPGDDRHGNLPEENPDEDNADS